MPVQFQLLKFNESGECVGINLNIIRHWAKERIPFHSHIHTLQTITTRTRRAYFEELKLQAANVNPLSWLIDLFKAIEYLETIVTFIHYSDETKNQCNLQYHIEDEVCPNREGIIFPLPNQQ